MQIAVTFYQLRLPRGCWVSPLCPGVFDWTATSRDPAKARAQAFEMVRKQLAKVSRQDFSRVFAVPGRRLERVRVEFTVRDQGQKKHLAGEFPVVIEPVMMGAERSTEIAYHPLQPDAWFEVHRERTLSEQVSRCYATVFDPDDDFELLRGEAREQLITHRFDARPPSLFDLLKKTKSGAAKQASAGISGQLPQLLQSVVNETRRAAEGELSPALPRPELSQRLGQLVCAERKTSLLLVGEPGSGKSTLIHQAVFDLLQADDYPAHRNLDRVHNVLRVSGRQIIAGMSYVGQWEARSVALLDEARRRRLILWVDDLHLWARIGRTTGCDRALADFFQGPIARGELVVIGESTPDQWTLLQHEAPHLARALSVVSVAATDEAQTFAMMLHECRRLEQELRVEFEPECFRQILDLSRSLLAGAAFPGKALGPLHAIARTRAHQAKVGDGGQPITPADVIRHFSRQTGLPEILLSPDPPLRRTTLWHELGQQILGQDAALEVACDLILALRTGLTAANRPYGVYLFTGPTGTGKTEMAKCLAAYLYGDTHRLLRFDMGEFSGADAPSRLIGDRHETEGLLTSRVRAQPFSVVLLDEIEKAHPSVLHLMLQLFDDGRLTDASGAVADFTHTVIVMTSNLGSSHRSVRGFADPERHGAHVIDRAVREFFPPELFNRIDRIVPFQPLAPAATREIAAKELRHLASRPGLAERNIFVRYTSGVVDELMARGYSEEYGARSIKRQVEALVADRLALAITTEAQAELRLLWAYRGRAGIDVYGEVLREIEPDTVPSSTACLMSENESTLRKRIPEALSRIEALEDDGRLQQLSERISEQLASLRCGPDEAPPSSHANQLFSLDALRANLRSIQHDLELRLASDPDLLAQERARKARESEEVTGEDFVTLGDVPPPGRKELNRAELHRASRGLARRGANRVRERPLVPWLAPDQLLPELVELTLLETLMERAGDANQHIALIDITRLAAPQELRRFSGGNPGLLEWLAQAYVDARGQFDSAAVRLTDGTVHQVSSPAGLAPLLEQRPQEVALQVLGPGVTRFLSAEAGCHLRRSAGAAPEIVRVQILPGKHDPLARLESERERQQRFEFELEQVGASLPNPDHLPPVVRAVRFEPDPCRDAEAIVEDYRLSRVIQRRVRRLDGILRELWLLAAGRQEAR